MTGRTLWQALQAKFAHFGKVAILRSFFQMSPEKELQETRENELVPRA